MMPAGSGATNGALSNLQPDAELRHGGFRPCLLHLLGRSGIDFGYGIAVDGPGSAYVTGYTSSTDFPPPISAGSNGGATDVFVAKINTGAPPVFTPPTWAAAGSIAVWLSQ